jgi:threonine aldolase
LEKHIITLSAVAAQSLTGMPVATLAFHNRAGGAVVPIAKLRELAAMARERKLRVHLDGARLWNAHVATGVAIADYAACADTVMMCFSKGLGAPVGSILTGSAEHVRAARRVRKRWGGGMRQVGILAAACLHALDHHVERLAIDHARARLLAAGMRVPGASVIEPDTNIVIATLASPEAVPTVLEKLKAQGVWMVAFGPGRIRAICHLDTNDEGIERAIEAFQHAVAG